MGHKIFVSYKYADDQVANLPGQRNSTVRNYVDKLEDYFDSSSHIYKGESSGEDLSQLAEETIWTKLRDRIFDSTMTIVFISPGMKVSGKKEKDQWIPWAISFSLSTTKRKTQSGSTYTSNPNAMLAVVLPDANGSYDYFHEKKNCCTDGCTTICSISNPPKRPFAKLAVPTGTESPRISVASDGVTSLRIPSPTSMAHINVRRIFAIMISMLS